ncbi:MAG: sigma-70 family RNA polymerase sigma factor [Terriglobales bacterium]
MPKPAQSANRTDTTAALYERSGAAAYGMSAENFAAILDEILYKYFLSSSIHSTSRPSVHALEVRNEVRDEDRINEDQAKEDRIKEDQKSEFCAALRLEELALARACAAGDERAWHDFISRYRQKLHSMALHITRDGAHAAELADSLFADLYGVNTGDGQRRSKLLSYTGRGSLEGWLRTVMAQEFINRYRKQKRTVSLEEQTDEGMQFAAAIPEPACTSDPRLEAAIDQALAELSSEDRFTLASYYLDGRTLAEIARTLRLHESSVSRRLDRLATGLRKRILTLLKAQGMSHAQATEALETDVRDMQLNLRSRLAQDSGAKAFPDSSRKVPAQEAGDGSTD